MIVFAHAGHWLEGLAYLAPVVCLGGWMTVMRIRDNRARRRAGEDGSA